MRSDRKLYNESFNVELDTLLTIYANIYQKVYHGGDLNGVCCIQLVENQEEIMKKVKEICERCLNGNTSDLAFTEEEMRNKLTQFSKLFESLDTTVAMLRIIAPTDEECKKTEKAIHILEKIWMDMDFSITPKVHILFNHAAEQQKMLEGLGDKGEGFVELAHQKRLCLD